MIKEQTFQDLYGYFFGMINRGDLDELYVRALEAIPSIVSLDEINDVKIISGVSSLRT
jgi:AAA+ superfamily predicted ATPase